jgi:hypothetical protein
MFSIPHYKGNANKIKMTLRFYLTLVRMAIFRNTITDVGKDMGEKQPL